MKPRHWNTARDGELSEDNFRRLLSGQGYDCNIYVYPPGTEFPDHQHTVDKIDGVLQGRFRISMAGHSWILEPGDSIAVPCGAVHSAAVVGSEPVVSIDAIRRERQSGPG